MRVAEQPDIEEENRPEPPRMNDDGDAGGERPAADDANQGAVELRISQPGKRRAGDGRRGGESAGRAGHGA